MGATLDQLAKSLRRVRFSEQGFQGDHKVVWHQGMEGCSLVTRVDREGKVVDHELTLGGDVVIWHRQRPVRTGRLRSEPRQDERGTNPRSAMWDLDVGPRPDILTTGVQFARLVQGDRYLAHLAAVLQAAVAGEHAAAKEVTKEAQASPDPPAPQEGGGLRKLLRRLKGG